MRKLLLLLLFAGCSVAPPVEKISNTQWPEAVIPVNRQQAVDMVVFEFSSGDTTIEDVSLSLVKIRMPSNDPWLDAWYRCTVCPDSYLHINMMFSDVPAGTRVVSQFWYVAPTYQGNENRVNLDHRAELYNAIQTRLWGLRDIVATR